MILNPHGIEPTFLKSDSWSPGAGFIPIITYNIIKSDKERNNVRKKSVLCIQKTFNTIFKNGLNPVWGSFPRLPFKRYFFLFSFIFTIYKIIR